MIYLSLHEYGGSGVNKPYIGLVVQVEAGGNRPYHYLDAWVGCPSRNKVAGELSVTA